MKIAIATDDFLTVTGHIGRCNGFIIYEIENNSLVSREQKENTFTHHRMGEHEEHHHGHEHAHSHSALVEGLKGCSHLICTAAGWRAVEDLEQNNIKVIFTSEHDADTAALKLADGSLIINEEGTCHAH
jgi:predicted Fe-Mo cluster-binding NifX family protein